MTCNVYRTYYLKCKLIAELSILECQAHQHTKAVPTLSAHPITMDGCFKFLYETAVSISFNFFIWNCSMIICIFLIIINSTKVNWNSARNNFFWSFSSHFPFPSVLFFSSFLLVCDLCCITAANWRCVLECQMVLLFWQGAAMSVRICWQRA